MAVHFFVPKPPILMAVLWDGSNFTEVSELVGTNRPMVDNGDGTITSGGGFYPETIIPSDTWITQMGNPLEMNYYQEVVSQDVQYEVS